MKRVKEILLTSTKLRSKEKCDFNIEDDTDDNILSLEGFLESKLQNGTHSEQAIDILNTSLIKEKGKDKPGCQKQNLVQFPIESALFQNEDIDCSQPLQSNVDDDFAKNTNKSQQNVEDTIISIIIDTSWYLYMNNELQENISKFH